MKVKFRLRKHRLPPLKEFADPFLKFLSLSGRSESSSLFFRWHRSVAIRKSLALMSQTVIYFIEKDMALKS